MNITKGIFSLILFFLLSDSYGTTIITSVQDGDWLSTATWDLSRLPTDEDIIVIPTEREVVISGDNITLHNVLIIVEGTLVMDNDFFDYADLFITGTNSGVIVEMGGILDERSLFDENLSIVVNGVEEWNGDTDGDVTGFIAYPAGLLNPLPVDLLYFQHTLDKKNNVLIQWATVQEQQNSHFVLERSTDSQHFDEIHQKEGKGNFKGTTVYEYLDNEVAQGTQAILYYRLKQVDEDGTYQYYPPISVHLHTRSLTHLNVYPAPFEEYIYFDFYIPQQEQVTITLFDTQGKKHFQQVFVLHEGSQHLAVENLSYLKPGNYILTLNHARHLRQLKVLKK